MNRPGQKLMHHSNTIMRASIFVALAGASLGCVDLTRPWDEAADAAGSPDVHDATPLASERPADAQQTPGREDGGSTDAASDARDGAAADASLDTGTDQGDDAPNDAAQALDGGGDSPVGEARIEDAVANEVPGPILDASLPDASLADAAIDGPAVSLDVGGEVAASSGLLAWYPCEGANGAGLPDISGQGRNAVLANGSGGTTPVGFSFGAGKIGNGLGLSAGDQAYVSLPKGLLAKLGQVTIATWVKLDAGTAYQRIFDFGADTNTFMYLANASSSGFVRFRIQSAALSKNQVLEGVQALPVGKWTHVAVTVGDNGVAIFLDGVQVAQQAPAVVRPSDLGETANNYIGRSQFASDPYLDGAVDELRIYDRVLGAAEIVDLASGAEK